MTDRIIVIGGSGGFGQRLVQGLVATTGFNVVVAGRDRRRVETAAAHFPASRVGAVALDARRVTPEKLRALGGFAVVDAAGPYQGADYRLVDAAIAAGLHYVDLADARDFVAKFAAPERDAAARAAGVVALSGASSTPALSHAVLDRLTAGWRHVDTVEVAISPGNRAAPRGLSVFRSILSYAGKPVRVFADGRWIVRPGWGMLSRRAMPGLGRRWLSLCETPDLDLIPARFAPRRAALFRAGLELPAMHLGLWLAGLAVRFRLLRSLLPFARPLRRIAGWLARFGSDRGGMAVWAAGRDAEDRSVRAVWSLVAGSGEGPFVPTLPALAALRLIAAGKLPAGARACVGELDLADIEREFRPYDIASETMTRIIEPPFRRLLGDGFAPLPAPVRRLHSLTEPALTAGRADVTVAGNPIARFLCWFAGLPRAGRDVPVTVGFTPDAEGGEFWERRFAGRRYASTMHAGAGRAAGLLAEHFPPFTYYHRLTASPEGVAWRLLSWRLLGISLPRWTVPAVNCCESAAGERYRFDIDVVFPLVGPVIHYSGWLLPADAAVPSDR